MRECTTLQPPGVLREVSREGGRVMLLCGRTARAGKTRLRIARKRIAKLPADEAAGSGLKDRVRCVVRLHDSSRRRDDDEPFAQVPEDVLDARRTARDDGASGSRLVQF